MGCSPDFPFGIEDVAELLHLRVRRHCTDGVYTDCPFCGDDRGKMKLNFQKNVWRCNYCGESGGMLSLYARIHQISTSAAYHEICEAIQNGICIPLSLPAKIQPATGIKSATRAENTEIHHTITALLDLLKLSEQHREHLKKQRGLTDEQIALLGYKSTPPFYRCRALTKQLIQQGCSVAGVPGFYQKDGQWTANFSTITSGILIPIRGIDGLIRGCQIRLDTPFKNGTEDKSGAKYIWWSSGSKEMGTSPGTPIHFVGDPFARTVYITEGALKADVAHLLMNRTFAAIAGINNTAQLDMLFALLAENGTQMIVEAADMDKFRNEQVNKGASKIYLLAKKQGLAFRRLTWNPNYKGIDDWQLALKRKRAEKQDDHMNFKFRYIHGLCSFTAMQDEISVWKKEKTNSMSLQAYLGFSHAEYELLARSDYEALTNKLLTEQCQQRFRIYQLRLDDDRPTIGFAFTGIQGLHKAGYQMPPAAEYNLIHEGVLLCSVLEDKHQRLEQIAKRYSDDLPEDYKGRSIAPSDVIELYDDGNSYYFYCDQGAFCQVQFSPALAKRRNCIG